MYRFLTYLFALVWLVNGLLCKVLGLVPRHAAIVARILEPAHVGLAEEREITVRLILFVSAHGQAFSHVAR